MKTIHKYPLRFGPGETKTGLDLPADRQIVHFGFQGADAFVIPNPYVWVIGDFESPLENITFRIVGTGWPIEEGWRFHGTTQQGSYVWHLFEVPA